MMNDMPANQKKIIECMLEAEGKKSVRSGRALGLEEKNSIGSGQPSDTAFFMVIIFNVILMSSSFSNY